MAKKQPTKRINRPLELVILLTTLILVIIFWETPFIYPIKLFVVVLHELSHAFATIISGGTVKEIEIGFDLGGKINTSGGNELIISSAGYIGSLLIGLFLFTSSHFRKQGKYFFYILSALIIVTLVNSNATATFIILCILIIISLVLLALFLGKELVTLFAKAIAICSSFYVFIDIKEDLFSKSVVSDAIILSNITGINEYVIGIIWLAVCLLLVFITIRIIYFSKKK